MSERETSGEIDAAAADWAVRVEGMPLDAKEQAALDHWLAGDTRRLGAFARARAVFAHAKRAKALGPDFDPNAFVAANEVVGLAPEGRAGVRARASRIDRRALLASGGGALAAGVATAMFSFTGQVAARTYSTGRGEIRLVPLSDGSTMTLNTLTTARVEFVEAKRRVELIDGEALFDIAHNAASPCIVRAGDSLIQAAGSSFTVSRLRNKPVQVLVRQGFVDIVGTEKHQQTLDRVSANSSAVIARTQHVAITQLAPAEVTRQLAWREGMLSFEDQPLRDAANEFARYSSTRIVFSDPGIGEETVTGLFAANNPVGFANSVALSLRLRAEISADVVTLGRDPK